MSGPRMWPSVLPAQVRADRYRAAEVKVYDRLKAVLGPDWTVFYSRPWLGLTATGGERDGECDFIIVHPRRGFLAVEVKGGGVSYDPALDVWTSRDRDNIRHRISNPVDQARKAKYELNKRLEVQKGWPAGRNIRMRHGVIFPDVKAPPGHLGADKPRDLFCCRDDMSRIADWVTDRLAGGDEDDLGRDAIQVIERLLAAPFTLKVPLASTIADDEAVIAALTPQQFHILDAVEALRRVAVGGAAGAGKTIVALEDAARLSAAGHRTLVTCVSEPLALDLAARLSRTDVVVQSFAQLCRTEGTGSATEFSDETDPQRLMDHMQEKPESRFDAIIVDEAQDFRSHWWIALEAALCSTESGRIHAYYDTNQSVYGDLTGELAGFQLAPIRLSRNLRNTKAIHQTSSRFYAGLPVVADGPQGGDVVWIAVEQDLEAAVRMEARRLLLHEDIRATELAVLAADAAVVARLRRTLTEFIAKGLVVETIEGFKGLECPVVLLLADSQLADQNGLAYVGLSRARSLLIVMGSAPILGWLGAPSTS